MPEALVLEFALLFFLLFFRSGSLEANLSRQGTAKLG